MRIDFFGLDSNRKSHKKHKFMQPFYNERTLQIDSLS